MPALVGIAPAAALRFDVDDAAVIGADERADLVLADADVAAAHAEVRRGPDGRYRIADLGAPQGTFVNGARVVEAALANGDEILVGASRLRFVDADDDLAIAPRNSLVARFVTGADFLAAYDAATGSFPVDLPAGARAEELGADGVPMTVVVRFIDTERDFRVHATVVARDEHEVRVAIVASEASRRELVLASARGESIPYYRRAARRVSVAVGVALTTEAGLRLASHSEDLSTRGLLFATRQAIEVGTAVRLRLAFPGRREPIGVNGRVRSVVRAGPRRGVGIEFVFGSREERDALAGLVAEVSAAR
jgi:hypothetical protein